MFFMSASAAERVEPLDVIEVAAADKMLINFEFRRLCRSRFDFPLQQALSSRRSDVQQFLRCDDSGIAFDGHQAVGAIECD